MEGWKIGRMESWKNGRLDKNANLFQPFNLPAFQPSDLPSFHPPLKRKNSHQSSLSLTFLHPGDHFDVGGDARML
jgi:hypothetical protein